MPGTSLARRHPRRTPLVAAALAGVAALLTAGLVLPALRVTQFSLFDTSYSILSGLLGLLRSGEALLFAVILLFSVVLPYLKLSLLGWLWFAPAEGRLPRRRVLRLVEAVGKWSMLDVLVVAVVVASLQGGFFVSARLQAGLYLFGGAVLASMALTAWLSRLAGRLAAAAGDAAGRPG